MESLRINIVIDELTDALRRSAGELELEQEVARIQRHGGESLVVAFVDVDALKTVNDSLGHGAGDELLQTLGRTFRARLRSYDSIARWGGDEFLVILPQTDLEPAAAIMEQIWTLFKAASDRTFSYGLAAFNPGESVAELVADLLAVGPYLPELVLFSALPVTYGSFSLGGCGFCAWSVPVTPNRTNGSARTKQKVTLLPLFTLNSFKAAEPEWCFESNGNANGHRV